MLKRVILSSIGAMFLLGMPGAAVAQVQTYYYTAEIPVPISTSPFQSFGNVTLSGSFDVDQGSVLPVSSWGVEGSTALQPVTMNVSNGNTVTATRNWYTKDFGTECIIATRGEAYVISGSLLGYFPEVDVPYSPETTISFDTLIFFLPPGCGNVFSSGATLHLTGTRGQLNLKGGGTSIGIVLRNATVSTTPIETGGPPIADAGPDFSVDEGALEVMLDGTGSSDPDDDPLSYAWTQVSGTSVTLTGAATATPSFDAPFVASGGETLTFELTVTANGEEGSDTVDVTVVNVNHVPVADAGDDQTVPEATQVTLYGGDSFDNDGDPLTYQWMQIGTGTLVALDDPTAVSPTFMAPLVGAGGETSTFQLTVDDGFPPDAPAPGYELTDNVDSVSITITNVNLPPTAEAGARQTVEENTEVFLDGGGSVDPDNDPLTYSWLQTGGTDVTLDNATIEAPSFVAPFVSADVETLTFQLTVDDGLGGEDTDSVVIYVQNKNDPPNADLAQPTIDCLWPPNHKLVEVGITGAFDPDGNATLTIDGVRQDEPTNGLGDGDTAVDAIINPDGTVLLRAERSGTSDGRVYHIAFTASDLEGSSSGEVTVCVPHTKKSEAIDDGALYDSTQ